VAQTLSLHIHSRTTSPTHSMTFGGPQHSAARRCPVAHPRKTEIKHDIRGLVFPVGYYE